MARVLRRFVGIGFIGFAAVIAVEIQLARGADRIDGYTRAQLDGRIGDGAGEPLRMVWIGDSTGDGVGATSLDRVLPRVVASELARPVELTVLAHTGDTVSDAIRDQLPHVGDRKPDWVFIALGGNDVTHLTSRGKFRKRLDDLLEGVKDAGPREVVLLSIGEFASTPLFAQPLRFIVGARGDQMNEDIRAAAARHGAIFVDIVERAGPAFVQDPARYHATDRFHPSDDGYGLWADATLAALRDAKLLDAP